jgi:hypothetical protein
VIRDKPLRTLGEALPELSEWVSASLLEMGRKDLANTVGSMPLTACWRGLVGNFNVGDLNQKAYSTVAKLEGNEPLWVYQPHGVRRRSWSIGLLVVGNRPRMLGVSRPGILRPALTKLEHQLGG